MTFETFQLTWPHGRLSVQSLGAMMAPVEFNLTDGRTVQPFAIAPWADDPQAGSLPPILQRLRGEWPCVPFGAARPLEHIVSDWKPCIHEESEGPPHGPSSNEQWRRVEQSKNHLTLELKYPETHVIQELFRTIRPDPNASAVDVELKIIPRSDADIPVAFHPVLKLGAPPGSIHLFPGEFEFGLTFPGEFEAKGVSHTLPGTEFSALHAVKHIDDGAMDLSRLPLEFDTENLVQLCGVAGDFRIRYTNEGYVFRLQWNRKHFPSCLLWISNRGRRQYPWLNRFLGLGVEPVCSAFDLGTFSSISDNPMRQRGIPTSISLKKHMTFITRYRMSVEALK